MSILINKNTKVITQGITGKTGQFHTRMCRDYANGKNCFVAGVNPKKAGEDFEGIPIYAHGEGSEGSHRRHRLRDLRAAAGRRRGDLTKRSRPTSTSSICITEGIPVRDMIRTRNRMQGKPDAAARPELPRPDHARRDQDRHHAGPHPPQGPHRRGLALGHAHLRSGRPADRARPRPVDARSASAATRSTA